MSSCRSTPAPSSESSTRRCSRISRSARITASSGPSISGTWRGAIPAPPIRSRPRSSRRAGVFWLGGDEPAIGVAPGTTPPIASRRVAAGSAAQPVMLTRLHLRYTPGDAAGGPDVPGNAGSAEFPDALCAPTSLDRRRRRLRGRSALLRRSGEATGARSADAGKLDRVGLEPDSRQDEHRRGARDACGGSGCGNDFFAASGGAAAREVVAAAREFLPKDARVFQILFLALLLTTGVLLRDFSLHPLQMALAFAAGLATQAFWLKRLGLEQRGFMSAIVTCCGLSLLLRSDTLWAHPLVGGAGDVVEVRVAHPRQALVQPRQSRRDRRDYADSRNVGVAGSMGQRSRACGLVVDAGNHRHQRARGGWTSAGCFWARFWGWSRCGSCFSANRGRSGGTSSATARCCCLHFS